MTSETNDLGLPWSIRDDDRDDFVDTAGKWVGMTMTGEKSRASCAYIVKAVNHHEALVELAQAALDVLDGMPAPCRVGKNIRDLLASIE